MKKYLIPFFLFLVLAFIATLAHFFYGEDLCGVCNNDVKQEQIEPENTKKTLKDLQILQLQILMVRPYLNFRLVLLLTQRMEILIFLSLC